MNTNSRLRDKVWWPLFDTVTIEGGTFVKEFFQEPIGMRGKTYGDTSQFIPGSLPMGQDFYCVGIGAFFVPNINAEVSSRAADINDTLTVLGRGYLTMAIQNRYYAGIAPLAAAVPPFPMYWAREDKALAELLDPSIADGPGIERNPENNSYKIVPLYIEAGQHYVVRVQMDPVFKLTHPGRLGVFLSGYMMRDTY